MARVRIGASAPKVDPALADEISEVRENKIMEIVSMDELPSERVFRIASGGRGRTGKSRLGCTMPKGIGYVPLDANSRATAKDSAEAMGIEDQVFFPKYDIMGPNDVREIARYFKTSVMGRLLNEGKATEESFKAEEMVKGFYKKRVEQVDDYLYTYAMDDRIKSGVIDTGMHLYDWQTFSLFGRNTNVRQRSRQALNDAMRSTILGFPKHLLITHPVTPEYVKVPGKEDKEPSGRYVMDCWPGMEYQVNIMVDHFKIENEQDEKAFRRANSESGFKFDDEWGDAGDREYPIFGIRAFNSQARKELNHDSIIWTNPERNWIGCDFADLAMLVYPNTDVDDWE